MEFYSHTVNGRRYDSRDLEIEGTRLFPESLAHYRRIVRTAYGDLRGVKFYTHPANQDIACGHCNGLFTSDEYRQHIAY